MGLLERDRELEALSRLIDRAREGGGGMVVIEAAAGIGKTTLLAACGEGAFARDLRVLRVRGDELVMESSFAAVRELLWPVVATGEALFDGAARLAAPVFEVPEAKPIPPDQSGVVMHGLYWLIADLAVRDPLVLLIDDAHWLDAASARFLLYLARRLVSLPVLAVVAVRRGEGDDPAGMSAALSEVSTAVLTPQPLTEAATGVLLAREFGAPVDDELCRSCHEATGGNPLYLWMLAAALRCEPGGPSLAAAERVRSLGTGTLARSVLFRLARLGEDCKCFAQALSVLAPGASLRHVALLAGLERERAEEAADRLRGADMVAPGASLTFAHPIVREAVAVELAPSRRAALHASAARILAADDAPPDLVAAHLLSTEPYGEPWVVEALRSAALAALARGAPEAAVSYLRRALEERPSREVRLELLVAMGHAEALLPIEQHFDAYYEALDLTDDPVRRVEIAIELCWSLTAAGRYCEIAELMEGALSSTDDLSTALVDRVESLLLGGGGPCLRASERLRARTVSYLERAERGEVDDPFLLAALAQTWGAAGHPAASITRFALRALEDERLCEFPVAYVAAAVVLAWTDHFEQAAKVQDEAIVEAQRRGSAPLFTHMSSFRAETALRAGDLQVAEGHLQPHVVAARELGVPHFGLMFLVPVLLDRGRVDEASDLMTSVPLGEQELSSWQGVIVLANRGRTRVELGELEAGVADLLEADRRMAAGGCQLSVLCDWVPAAASALLRLGRRDAAHELTSRELNDARRFGTRRRVGMALSACGVVDPADEGLDQLREAVVTLESSPARLEHARALVNLGAGLRERGRREEAREPLARGLDLADRCGAIALADRAHRELVAAGARPRRRALTGPDSLTPAELRTARLAAEGLTNREIAQALFITTKTVEWQLSHAYAKLGVGGRGELLAALGAEGTGAVEDGPSMKSPG